MCTGTCSRRTPAQRGLAALEFALVFPLLFVLLYGMLTYSLVFATQHVLSLAAAEGSRAAMRFHSSNDSAALRQQAACATVKAGVGWLERISGQSMPCPAGSAGALRTLTQLQSCPAAPGAAICMVVEVQFDYGAAPLIPVLPWLPVPARLSALAVAHIALSY